jgi:hypothetical protein
MHYGTADTTVKLNSLNAFLKQMGLSDKIEPEESIKLTKRDIPEETKVVVLSHKH